MLNYVKILTSETMIMEEINRVKHIKVLMSTVPSFNRRQWQRREHFYAIKTILISCSLTPMVYARNFLANLIINSIMYGIYNLRNTWHMKFIIIKYIFSTEHNHWGFSHWRARLKRCLSSQPSLFWYPVWPWSMER